MINQFYIFILIGLFSGFFTGAIGIGAGILMIPLLTNYGMKLREAVATGLVIQLVPQSIFGALEYYKNGYVKWYETFYVLIGSTIGIYMGSLFTNKKIVSRTILYLVLSIILFCSSIYIFVKHVIYKKHLDIVD